MSFGLGETGRPQYDSDKLLDVRRKARADFVFIAVVAVIACVTVLFDPNGFFEWVARRREVQFDEFLVTVVIIGTGFAVFSWRRWTDLSRQVAELKRLQTELTEVNRQASALSETDDLLQSCLSSEEAYHAVIRHIQSQLPGFSGAICTINNGRDLVEAVAKWGEPALVENFFAPKDCWGLRRGRVNIRSRGGSQLNCAHIGPELPGYAICVPMMAQGETLGSYIWKAEGPRKEKAEHPPRPSANRKNESSRPWPSTLPWRWRT